MFLIANLSNCLPFCFPALCLLSACKSICLLVCISVRLLVSLVYLPFFLSAECLPYTVSLFVCLSLWMPSACQPFCVPVCLCTSFPVYFCTCLSLSACLRACLVIFLSPCLPLCQLVFISTVSVAVAVACLSICLTSCLLPVYPLPIYLSACLFAYLSFCCVLARLCICLHIEKKMHTYKE